MSSDRKTSNGVREQPSPPKSPLPPSEVPRISDISTDDSRRQDRLRQTADLLPSPFPADDDEIDQWEVPNRSPTYQIWLTLVMAGIQIAWSVELAYISPYLLSLGLPKSALSLIWVAGPVSGVVVQPIIGTLSDRTKFKWGRRRIFIIASTIGCVLGFLGMGKTRQIVSWWTGLTQWESIRAPVIVLAVVSLVVLDLAINASISSVE